MTFRDKGEQGPAELAEALARADESLTPRARACRTRARVRPIVDYRDVPVYAGYLESLAAHGIKPIAVSRWLNRAAVRLASARLVDLAELPFVERLTPVESVMRSRDPIERVETPPAAAPGTELPAPRSRGAGPHSGSSTDGATRGGTWASSDPEFYGRTYAQLAQLDIPALHDSGYIGAGVLVCVLDDGFNFHDKHEALRDRIVLPGLSRDFVDGDTTVTDTSNPCLASVTMSPVLDPRKHLKAFIEHLRV